MSNCSRRGITANLVQSATRSQSSRRYGNNAGKQCVAMSLAYGISSHNTTWSHMSRTFLNSILDLGNEIYTDISCRFEKEYLMVCETPSEITWKDTRYEICHFPVKYGTIYEEKNVMISKVTNAFTVNKLAFFMCREMCVMLKCDTEGAFTCFDSHCRDSKRAQITVDGEGNSTCVKFCSFMSLIDHLRLLFKGGPQDADAVYNLVPVRITSSLAVRLTDSYDLLLNYDRPVGELTYVVGSKVRGPPQQNHFTHPISFHHTPRTTITSTLPQKKRKSTRKADSATVERLRLISPTPATAVVDKSGSIIEINSEVYTSSPEVANVPSAFETNDLSPGPFPSLASEVSDKSKKSIRVKLRKTDGSWSCIIGKKGKNPRYLDSANKKRVHQEKVRANQTSSSTVHVSPLVKDKCDTPQSSRKKKKVPTATLR